MNETFIPEQLAQWDINRISGYKELIDFYYGRHWEGRAVRGGKRLTFNYAKVFIDKLTSYLMSGINFAVDLSWELAVELGSVDAPLAGVTVWLETQVIVDTSRIY